MSPRDSLVVRRAGAGDAELLGRLNGVVQQVHHEALPQRFKSPDSAAATTALARQVARPEVVAFIAEDDAGALGYAVAEELRTQGTGLVVATSALYLHHLAVVDEGRRRGVGRLLVSTVEEEARWREVDEVRLDYWSFNEPAQRFFAAMGYEPYNVRARRLIAGTGLARK